MEEDYRPLATGDVLPARVGLLVSPGMGRLVILTERSPSDALPALFSLGHDVKTESLSEDSLGECIRLSPAAILVDGADPGRAFEVLRELAQMRPSIPAVAVVRHSDIERFAWADVADEIVHPSTGPAELRVRMAMLARRSGRTGDATILLGPLSMDTETYQVLIGGRLLDLTYKEFELLRFLIQHPGKVFTRGELLRRVWGYDFYGGTRTVDVHVRRLRAKLGVENEHIVQTVRGVGYGAIDPMP
jgi:DNA-binding response OmpR family regulator